jgi:Leucine-rich repeat (LRR) protein
MRTLLPLLLAVFGGRFLQDDQKEEVVKQIEKLGGSVLTHRGVKSLVLIDRGAFAPFGDPRSLKDQDIQKLDLRAFSDVYIMSKSVSDGTLSHLAEMPRLNSVVLFHTRISDNGLKAFISKKKALFCLRIYSANITDDSLPAIGSMRDLFSLSLARTKISDKGLKHLRELQKLRSLALSGTPISDAGLTHVAHLKNLRSLSLQQTAVTDAGILRLKTLRKLRTLDIASTKVTKKGEKALQRELPWLDIISEDEDDGPNWLVPDPKSPRKGLDKK